MKMFSNTARRLLLIAGLASLLAGCAAPPPYRWSIGPDKQPCQLEAPTQDAQGRPVWESDRSACAHAWAVRSKNHGINYIEIDEQGMLSNRQAMEDALAYAGAPGTSGKPAYVLVFVHGWHHNGSADDENVQAFHSALEALRAWHDGKNGHDDNEVRGIYISWRGESLSAPGLRYLTFWDRKNTSDEVGRGGLLEFLLRLERAVKPPSPKTGAPSPSPNKLVLIGHSFGASVTFNALAHLYMERFVDGVYSDNPGPRFRGYGDLVMLINPAIEAMRYAPFQNAINDYATRATPPHANFEFDLLPKLVILSSEGDWATRKTFRVARFFSTAFEKHVAIDDGVQPDEGRQDSEWVMDQVTVGNYDGFHTHWPLHIVAGPAQTSNQIAAPDSGKVKALAATGPGGTRGPGDCRRLRKADIQRRLAVDSAIDPAQAGPNATFEEFPDSNIRIVRKQTPVKGSPYVLADVGTEIIANHSQIDNLNLICWADQLVSGTDAGPP